MRWFPAGVAITSREPSLEGAAPLYVNGSPLRQRMCHDTLCVPSSYANAVPPVRVVLREEETC
jgi:hypothetical protein